jgi:hypothetical protein
MDITANKPIQVQGKQTKWSKEPELSDLKADLNNSTAAHSAQVNKITRWLDVLHMTGNAKPVTAEGKSKVAPKLVRTQAEWRYASLSEVFLSSTDLFNVNPLTWEDVKSAQQNELILNNQFDTKIDKVAFIDKMIRACVNEGTAILRTGWNHKVESVTEEVPNYMMIPDPSYGPELQQIMQLIQQKPDYLEDQPDEVRMSVEQSQQAGMPIRVYQDGTRTETKQKVIANHPTVEVVDFSSIYVDPTCQGDISKAQFIIHRFETSLSDLKRDGRYKNLDKIVPDNAMTNTETGNQYDSTNNASSFTFKDEPRKKMYAYEYWGYYDYDNSGIAKPMVCTWVGNTIIRMDENPYPDKQFPFVFIPFMPVKGSLYGEPDAELLEDNQKIKGAVTRGMIDLMAKTSAGQTGFAKGTMDQVNMHKFRNGQDYEFNANNNPQYAIHTSSFPEIPQSAPFMLQMVNTDSESLTGVRAFAGTGVSGVNLGQTAEAVRTATDAATKREIGIVRRLGNGMVQVARKFLMMNAMFLEEEEVVRITNENFVSIKRDDLKGEYDLRINISTPEEDASKSQNLSFILQTLGNNLPPEIPVKIMAKIVKLHKLPDLAHFLETWEPQPDPMQEALKQLELAKIQAETELLKAQAREAASKSFVQDAKVGVENARAGHMQSQTDKNNLDFYNNAEGITHQQAKDLQQQKLDNELAKNVLNNQNSLELANKQHNTAMLLEHAKASLQPKEKSVS